MSLKYSQYSDVLDTICSFVIEHCQSVPDNVRSIARLHIADSFGVGYTASKIGPLGQLASSNPILSVPGSSQVLGRKNTLAPTVAALINGTLIHSLEFDDTHTESVMHGSSVMLPATLAYGQAIGLKQTERFIDSYIIGWELLIRLGNAAPSQFQNHGFQGTSVAGAIASALATGSVAGAGKETLFNAMAIAMSYSSGNFTFLDTGATSKAAQAGIAAQGGLSAFGLAQNGITGGSNFLEGPRGFFSLYAGDPSAAARFAQQVETLGERWHITDAAFKEYPCCHFIHPFIEIAIELSRRLSDVSSIRQIILHVPEGQESIIALPWTEKQRPATAAQARWSLPYVFAVSLIEKRINLDTFQGTLNQEAVRLAQRITWQKWDNSGYPSVFPARAEIETINGQSLHLEVSDVNGKGDREWSREEVWAKFSNNMNKADASNAYRDQIWYELVDSDYPDLSRL